MIELAHEFWEDPETGRSSFYVPNASWDAMRARDMPNAKLVHVIMATCWQDAQQQHYDRLGWGEYETMPGVTDQPYTVEQLADLKAVRDY